MGREEDKNTAKQIKYPENEWLVLAHQSLIHIDNYLKEKYKSLFTETAEELILLLSKLMHHRFKTISSMKDPEKGNEGDDLEKYEVKSQKSLCSFESSTKI